MYCQAHKNKQKSVTGLALRKNNKEGGTSAFEWLEAGRPPDGQRLGGLQMARDWEASKWLEAERSPGGQRLGGLQMARGWEASRWLEAGRPPGGQRLGGLQMARGWEGPPDGQRLGARCRNIGIVYSTFRRRIYGCYSCSNGKGLQTLDYKQEEQRGPVKRGACKGFFTYVFTEEFLYVMYFGLQEAKPPPCPLLLTKQVDRYNVWFLSVVKHVI